MTCPTIPGQSCHRAVTLIEAVLFISVALGLIVGGIVFYRQASLSARVGEQSRLISAVIVELRAMAQTVGVADIDDGHAGDLDSYLVASGSIPAQYIGVAGDSDDVHTNQTDLRTPWGEGMNVFLVDDAAIDNPLFGVWLRSVPVAACARLAATDARGSAIYGDGITNIGIRNARPGLGLVTPISPSEAARLCADADNDGNGNVDISIAVRAFN